MILRREVNFQLKLEHLCHATTTLTETAFLKINANVMVTGGPGHVIIVGVNAKTASGHNNDKNSWVAIDSMETLPSTDASFSLPRWTSRADQ